MRLADIKVIENQRKYVTTVCIRFETVGTCKVTLWLQATPEIDQHHALTRGLLTYSVAPNALTPSERMLRNVLTY